MPDARVQSAIDHWGPRFIQAGVDYNDFAAHHRAASSAGRTGSARGRGTGDEHVALAREAEAAGRTVTAGEAWLRAAVAYHFAQVRVGARRRRAAGPRPTRRSPRCARPTACSIPTAERIEAPLDGAAVVGKPAAAAWGVERPPLVLLIPGLDSTKEEFFLLENLFLARGMATLSLDGPGPGRGRATRCRCGTTTRSRVDRDPRRARRPRVRPAIGALGVSLGGYYAPRAAAFEPRIRAVAGHQRRRSTSASCGTRCRSSRARRSCTSRAPPATRTAAARALELDLDGVLEQLEQPALFVTGRLDRLIPWESDRARRRGGAARRVRAVRGRQPRVRERAVHGAPAGRGLAARAARVSLVGRPVRRREDERILRGRTRYVDDIDARRPAAHRVRPQPARARARIASASRVAGRRRRAAVIVTAADLAGRARRCRCRRRRASSSPTRRTRSSRRTRSATSGSRSRRCVAASRAAAEDAAELVDVEYEPLDAVVARATLLRLRARDRRRRRRRVRGRRARRPHAARRSRAPSPRRSSRAASSRTPTATSCGCGCRRRTRTGRAPRLAHVLDRPPESIHVIARRTSAARSGARARRAPEVVAVAASRRSSSAGRSSGSRPRSENFLAAYQGRGVRGRGRAGARRRRADARACARGIVADLGAYLYRQQRDPAAHDGDADDRLLRRSPPRASTVVGARTDKVPTGPCRGAGRPEAAYLLERTVDAAARELGIDPVELRRRNLVRSFPHRDAARLDLRLRRLRAVPGRWRSSWSGPSRRPGASGTGVALYVERAGGQWESARDVARGRRARDRAQRLVPARPGPRRRRSRRSSPTALGVPMPSDVELRFGDSAEVPAGVGTFGGRSIAMGGSAVAVAADRLAAGERTRLACASSRTLVFGSGAYAAVVEIDAETGALTVHRIAAVDDAGTIINPLLAEGQVLGGAVHGLGAVLTEEIAHDEDGQPLTASFAELRDAQRRRAAAESRPRSSSRRRRCNPLGAKGIGEAGTIGTPAAIANAVADALGGRHVDPPFTPEKLWRALRRLT